MKHTAAAAARGQTAELSLIEPTYAVSQTQQYRVEFTAASFGGTPPFAGSLYIDI